MIPELPVQKPQKNLPTVGVVALARNCVRTLPLHLKALERMRSRWPGLFLVVVENDSTDGTKQLLEKWRSQTSWLSVLTLDGKTAEFDARMRQEPHPWFSAPRIEKMAFLRNQYLDFLQAAGLRPDLLVVFDPDLHWIDFGALQRVLLSSGWDALMAASTAFEKGYHWWRGSIYYDTYAFKRFGDRSPKRIEEMERDQHLVLGQLRSGPLQVESAFGGLAVYRWAALQGLRYSAEPNADEVVKVLCEHHCLHRRMVAERGARLFVTPELVAHYHGAFRAVGASLHVLMRRLKLAQAARTMR